MRIDGGPIRIAILAAALAGFGLMAAPQSAAPAKKAAPAKPSGPLLRKDLLAGARVGVSAVRRDIFLPQGPGADMPIVMSLPMGARPRPVAADEEMTPAEEAPPVVFRYVGFIRAQGKFLALVLIDGQSAALAEGDPAGAAGRIVRIAANEIEILGPDGKSFKLPLEGERK
jgi:hypothetical protein